MNYIHTVTYRLDVSLWYFCMHAYACTCAASHLNGCFIMYCVHIQLFIWCVSGMYYTHVHTHMYDQRLLVDWAVFVQSWLFSLWKIECEHVDIPTGPKEVSPDCATTSNSKGDFVFPSLPPGIYTLVSGKMKYPCMMATFIPRIMSKVQLWR